MSLDTININQEVPEKFDKFLVFFENWLSGQKEAMKKFLGVNYNTTYSIEEAGTFAFSPVEKKVIIPISFLQGFHEKLISKESENPFLHTFDDLKFGLYHELSHFRDMINEKDRKKRNNMVDILNYVGNQKIKFGDDKIIPIGKSMHSIVNCIDDIIVNTEVEMNLGTGIENSHLNGFYKYNLFADIKEKDGGDYIIVENRIKYTGKGKGTHEINDKKEVDYSERDLSSAFPYYFLRSFMVHDQDIKLPDKVASILYGNEHKTSVLSYKRSINQMIKNMKSYFIEMETNGNEVIKERVKKLKAEYLKSITELQEISEDKTLEKVIEKSIKQTGTTNIYTPKTIKTEKIIELFLMSTGKENTHSLDISPGVRYEIYKKLFIPLQKGFILMDLLKQDIKEDKSKKDGKGGGKGDGKGDGKGELDGSGTQSVHESPDIDEKVKLLEDLNDEEDKKKTQELIKKQVEQSKYDTLNLIDKAGFPLGQEALNNISEKYTGWIKEIVDFFIKELTKLDIIENIEIFDAKKGKLKTRKLFEYIGEDPTLSDVEKQRFYDKKNHIEKISELLKHIDLTLAIDISGSTSSFRDKNGIMNIISTILFIAMKHLEVHIRNLLDDPNYNIPVNYILYGDGEPFSSHNSTHKNSPEHIRMAELNEQVISLSGGTNDTTAWKKISDEEDKFLSENPIYVKEIKTNKRKPIIVQIADSDVSENGVEELKDVFVKHLGDKEIVDKLPIKRIILGNIDIKRLTKNEYLDRKDLGELGNWEETFLPDGTVQLKQISIKRRDDITKQIKELFEGFFKDLNYK